MRLFFIGLTTGLTVNAAIVMFQLMGWQGVQQIAPPAGLFANRNLLGETAALGLVAAVAWRLWYGVPGCLGALLATNARGALLGAAVGLLALLWRWSRLAAGGLAVVGTLVLVGWTGRGTKIESVIERVGIWQDAVLGMTLFGHGSGSFYTWYPAVATLHDTLDSRPDHAHNDFLEVAFELGLPGIAIFLALCWASWRWAAAEVRPVLACGAVIACFGFPLHTAAAAGIIALVAGYGAGFGPRVDAGRWLGRGRVRDRGEQRRG